MSKGQQLGLDELMIVNPGPSGIGALFLGEDGTLYQMRGASEQTDRTGQFFLGEDGTLYQVQGFDAGGSVGPAGNSGEGLGDDEGRELGRYFLGADGALYEVVR